MMRNLLYGGVDRLEKSLHTLKGWIDRGRPQRARSARPA